MKKRDFLKLSGISVLGSGLGTPTRPASPSITTQNYRQQFNMSGYAAPKIDTVRMAYIGMGNRGGGAVKRIIHLDNVDVKALCYVRPEQAAAAAKTFVGTSHKPELYSGVADVWKKVCERPDIDLVYICSRAEVSAGNCQTDWRTGQKSGWARRHGFPDGLAAHRLPSEWTAFRSGRI